MTENKLTEAEIMKALKERRGMHPIDEGAKLTYVNELVRDMEYALRTERAEAIKEFAERVKKLIVMCYYDLGDLEDTMLLEKDIDQIAKEMGVEL